MTGAVAVLAGTAPSAPPAGSAAPAALSWSDIYAEDSGSTQALTVTGLVGPTQLTATHSGLGLLSYVLNGVYTPYTGGFTVNPNDTLAWAVAITGATDRSGVVTVATGGATPVDSFNYTVYSSRGVRA